MALEFEWDPRKAVTNLAKHDVSFEEAATVFGDPLGLIVADPRHSSVEQRLVLLGFSEDRQLLAVMYVELSDHSDHKCAKGHTPGATEL